MASATHVLEIQEEIKCPICLEYLRDPVTINCGHNFCRACIAQYCDTWNKLVNGPLCCPSCRAPIQKGALRKNNYQLASIVEKIKHLDLKQGTGNLCGRHDRSLDLFCEEDGEAICVVCWRSLEHRSHTVLIMEEAAQKYKKKVQSLLKTLRKEREMVLGFKLTAEEKSQEYLKQTEAERQNILSQFQQLRQFLEERERLLLAQLANQEKKIVGIQNENVTKLSAEISHLSELISEVECKCQKPDSEFLQDIRSTLSRCEKGHFQQPEKISSELDKRLSNFSQKTVALLETLRTFKDTLLYELEREGATVTLDPDTAHPWLVLSADGKSVRYGRARQDLPDTPERFNTVPCVLGREGFTAGRHSWEVEVEGGECWAVGVARESMGRKGWIKYSPGGGIWAVRRSGDQFRALTSPETPLPRSQVPSRIGVCLDCGRGQVTFFDADDEAPIFTFRPGSVPRERLRPWLQVGDTETRLRLRP